MTQDTKIVAEIHVSRSGGAYVYQVFPPGVANAVDQIGTAPTDKEAFDRAVDVVRLEPHRSGMIAVFSPDGSKVAHAPLWCVPSYPLLQWQETAQVLELL